MFEFLVTLFVCGDVKQPATCQPLGQKTAVYRDRKDCGVSAFTDVSEALSSQGLKPEEIDHELESLLVICQQGKRVTSV